MRRGVDEKKRRKGGGRKEGGREEGREEEREGGREGGRKGGSSITRRVEKREKMEDGKRRKRAGKDITCANLYYKDVAMGVI